MVVVIIISESNDKLSVYKRDDMIQSGRYRLTLLQQRIVLYAIGHIKSDDSYDSIYEFRLKDLYKVSGMAEDSYTRFKDVIQKLDNINWWITINGKEVLARWFSYIEIDPQKNTAIFQFHKGVAPYLFDLVRQNKYYTRYELENILPMTHQASPRLYELLKSYSKNNDSWYFDLDKFKKAMDCESYKLWGDIRRRILDPSMEEINAKTDLKANYELERNGKKVVGIRFKFYKGD